MADPKEHERREATAAQSSLLLLQVAASEAQIGPFARRSLEAPQAASRSYRETSRIVTRRAACR
jgi:hypothetical protein